MHIYFFPFQGGPPRATCLMSLEDLLYYSILIYIVLYICFLRNKMISDSDSDSDSDSFWLSMSVMK